MSGNYDGRPSSMSIYMRKRVGYIGLGIGTTLFAVVLCAVLMLIGGNFHDPPYNSDVYGHESGGVTAASIQNPDMGPSDYTKTPDDSTISVNETNPIIPDSIIDHSSERIANFGDANEISHSHREKISDRGNKAPDDRRDDSQAKILDLHKEDATIPDNLLEDWRILLVNSDNPVPKDYSVKLTTIVGDVSFDERAADDFKNLLKDCRQETGSRLRPRTGYRSKEIQDGIYKDKIRKHMDRGKTREEAKKLTEKYIAVPGTSEHEIGLAVDFNTLKAEFENTEAFKWLDANAHKYGFILRYPEDKQFITKIKYEPWHFRYVGPAHAQIMKSNNLCLEEYIDYLKD